MPANQSIAWGGHKRKIVGVAKCSLKLETNATESVHLDLILFNIRHDKRWQKSRPSIEETIVPHNKIIRYMSTDTIS